MTKIRSNFKLANLPKVEERSGGYIPKTLGTVLSPLSKRTLLTFPLPHSLHRLG